MATVAGIVVHCVTDLIGWTAAVISTGFSWFDIVDHSVASCPGQKMNRHYQQVSEKTK